MDPRVASRKLEILQGLATKSAVPIDRWQARTAEHLGPGEYRYDGPWRGIDLPARFPAGRTVFLRAEATVPPSAAPADSYFRFDFQDMEGLLSVADEPYAGLDGQHSRVPVPRRGRCALEAEFLSVPAAYHRPDFAGRCGVFACAAGRSASD